MAGYTKQDTSGKIANGNIVDADDFNDEFNTLQTAFGVSGGHDHSSTTAGNGAPITKAGADYRYEFTDDALIPKTSFTSIDIGSATRTFDTAHFSGKVNSATLETTGAATLNSLVVGSSTAVTAIDTDLASVAGTDTTLASAKSIKAYVDAQVTASDLDLSDGSATIAIDLDSETLIVAGGTGITTSAAGSTITISSDDANINHDTLSNFVGNEHIDHTGVSVTAGNGLTGGGTIAATRTLTVDPHTGIAVTADGVALSHLGLQDLVDPNADRVAFWDDTAAKFDWLTMGTNLAITDTTLNATDTNTTYVEATDIQLGLVKIGYIENAKNYPVELTSGKMFVNVPWVDTNTDTNTTYTAGTGLTLTGTVFSSNHTTATNSTEGLVKIGYTENAKNYPVELSSGAMFVNVPWTDTAGSYTAGTGLTLTNNEFTVDNTQSISAINALSGLIVNTGTTNSNNLLVVSTDPNQTGTVDNLFSPDITLYRNSNTPAANDWLGHLKFTGNEVTNGTAKLYASIYSAANNVTSGSESGAINFSTARDGNTTDLKTGSGVSNGDGWIGSNDVKLLQATSTATTTSNSAWEDDSSGTKGLTILCPAGAGNIRFDSNGTNYGMLDLNNATIVSDDNNIKSNYLNVLQTSVHRQRVYTDVNDTSFTTGTKRIYMTEGQVQIFTYTLSGPITINIYNADFLSDDPTREGSDSAFEHYGNTDAMYRRNAWSFKLMFNNLGNADRVLTWQVDGNSVEVRDCTGNSNTTLLTNVINGSGCVVDATLVRNDAATMTSSSNYLTSFTLYVTNVAPVYA